MQSAKTRAITDQLGETQTQPRTTIWRFMRADGEDHTRELLECPVASEAAGGMLTRDGTTRRTPGGAFLALVKDAISAQERAAIFGYQKRKKRQATPAETLTTLTVSTPAPVTPAAPFAREDRLTLWATIGDQAGEGKSMKVTLIGQPGTAIDKGSFVMLSMPVMKQPELPKGLPPLPADVQTQYLVYIATKQWKKVATAATDPDDALIVEGFATYDPDIKGMSVFATNTSSKKLQAAIREQKHHGEDNGAP